MDDLCVTQHVEWFERPSGRIARFNRMLARFGARFRLTAPGDSGQQCSLEQRINLYHLVSQVLAYRVPGDLVEIGTHEGSTAVILQSVNEQHPERRMLHVYDAFWGASQEVMLGHFRRLGLTPPQVHAARIEETLPGELPVRIAFAHIDLGWGQPPDEHRTVLLHALKAVHPRLAPGGVCVLADYCEPDVYKRRGFAPPWITTASSHWNLYPAVKEACDRFFADKTEAMIPLFGGPYSHGFFRKASPAPEDAGPVRGQLEVRNRDGG